MAIWLWLAAVVCPGRGSNKMPLMILNGEDSLPGHWKKQQSYHRGLGARPRHGQCAKASVCHTRTWRKSSITPSVASWAPSVKIHQYPSAVPVFLNSFITLVFCLYCCFVLYCTVVCLVLSCPVLHCCFSCTVLSCVALLFVLSPNAAVD